MIRELLTLPARFYRRLRNRVRFAFWRWALNRHTGRAARLAFELEHQKSRNEALRGCLNREVCERAACRGVCLGVLQDLTDAVHEGRPLWPGSPCVQKALCLLAGWRPVARPLQNTARISEPLHPRS